MLSKEENRLSLIVAHDKNRVIGRDGRLPWHIPGELKRFKELTTGQAVIMGRKSYAEIGKPLPDRLNIVLSGTAHFEGENLRTAQSIEEALSLAEGRKIFIAGGAQIFAQLIDRIDVLYITEINAVYEGDAFFPQIDYSRYKRTVEKHVSGTPSYDYVTYIKK